MKKLISIAVCLCLVLALLAGCGKSSQIEYYEDDNAAETAQAAESTAEPDPDVPEPTPRGIALGGTGFETYPADTVVGTVNGTDVTWMEYFYWLRYYTTYVQQLAAQYGFVLDGWDANDLSADNTNADVVIMNAQQNIVQDHVIQTEVPKLGAELSEEDEQTILSIFEQNADSVTGDGDGTATEEEMAAFEEYLAGEMFVDRAFFDQFNATALLSERGFEAAYGENGADLSDEEVREFAEENGMMAAKHILLLTVDMDTREPLSDEEIAEKKALADDLLAQLREVEGDQEALEALFDELTAEYTEDTGYAYYPDGYVFVEGQMVEAFENAVEFLDVYGLSDVVESEYGYHIILRIPVDPDASAGTDSYGNDVSLRYAAATQQFSGRLQAWMDSADVTWNEGFENPDMQAIFG